MEGIAQISTFVAWGLVLGAFGQGARTVVGLKKAMDGPSTGDPSSWLDFKKVLTGLLIGAFAGVIAALVLEEGYVDKNLLVTVFVAGYAGTDFIEGFIKARALKSQDDLSRQAAEQRAEGGQRA